MHAGWDWEWDWRRAGGWGLGLGRRGAGRAAAQGAWQRVVVPPAFVADTDCGMSSPPGYRLGASQSRLFLVNGQSLLMSSDAREWTVIEHTAIPGMQSL